MPAQAEGVAVSKNAVPLKVILALPAYNEAENLPPLIEQAVRVFRQNEYDYAILVVNDGSTDSSGEVLEEMAAREGVRVATHPQNRGLGAAINTAIRSALEFSTSPDDIIVNMDADNTHDPAYIPAMADKIWSGEYDAVIASRFRENSREVGVPFLRRMLSRGARIVFRVMLRLPEVRDYTCGYRAYRASLLQEAIDRYGDRLITRSGFACTDELLVRISSVSRRITEIPFVLRYDQKKGESKLPLFRTVVETLKLLIFRK